jgi:hypothetical protein
MKMKMKTKMLSWSAGIFSPFCQICFEKLESRGEKLERTSSKRFFLRRERGSRIEDGARRDEAQPLDAGKA